MSESNNKYYKQWLKNEYENKRGYKTNFNIDLFIGSQEKKLSRIIDKIKTEEQAKKYF
jgi:hypothetical protein